MNKNNEKIQKFKEIQDKLKKDIKFQALDISKIKYVAGVDIAYCYHNNVEYGCCSIIVIDFATLQVVEKCNHIEQITLKYIPGYLAFRELPVILNTKNKLKSNPDIFIFDGNGYLHPNNMGIATHASFYLNKPCIGVAKTYFKIDEIDFAKPKNYIGATTEIVRNKEILGLAMRSRVNYKPIFISCGNYITLDNCKDIIQKLLTKNSRIPIPTRLADIETHKVRKDFLATCKI